MTRGSLLMRSRLIRLIPNSLKPVIKKVYYFPADLIDRLRGVDGMTPPKSMIFVGDDDFKKIGLEFKNYFIELAGLKPGAKVLDVGCGIGRMAIPLTGYLSEGGEYWGFDIARKGVEWCQNHVSSVFKNFHFQHSDVYNKHYNPRGTVEARQFRFPFDAGFFDFVFLTSVFTHMLPTDMERYLSEISRVLKPGGSCLITFYLINDESEDLMKSGRSSMDFRYKIDDCFSSNKKNPEAAIAYRESHIIELFNKYGLSISQPIHYGSWCERNNYLSWQDLIVARKDNSV